MSFLTLGMVGIRQLPCLMSEIGASLPMVRHDYRHRWICRERQGTLAKRLASHLGLSYLDTGALYRAVGLQLLNAGQDIKILMKINVLNQR